MPHFHPTVVRPPAPPTDAFLEMLLQQGEDYALFFMNPEGLITDWFRGAEQIFGFTAEEIIGQPVFALFTREDIERGAPDNEFEMARAAGRAEDDRWHVRKDGSRFWGSGVLVALKGESGDVIGYAKIVRNRTDLKTQTEALENHGKSLSKQLDHQKVFLASIVHELRNPLAPLTNALALIRHPGNLVPACVGAIQIIDRQMAVLSRLVDDLMDMARIGAGKVDLNLEMIDLREVANIAVESVRPLARQRDQDLEFVAIGSQVLVRGDRERLQQIFGNLLTNAIKYTPRNGRIVFNITTEGDDAVARVEDNGIGMDAEILPKVFELFTQEDASRKISLGGLGLGLALVRDLVDLHGGKVLARSDGRNKGSLFVVRLPLQDAAQP